MSFRVAEAYAPRPTLFQGVAEHAGWRVKRWFVRHPQAVADHARFEGGEALAMAALPAPAETDERPGVAVVVAHQGRGVDYVVLGWWDRENELPVRVWVRDGGVWREGRGAESFCVWDLEVLWRERQAYVRDVLCPPEPRWDAYLREPSAVETLA